MPLSIRRSSGFTLVELMIVVSVISVLALIAYPSYHQQVLKSRRTEAESTLVQLSMVLERVFTENNSYRVGGVDPCLMGGGCAQPIFTNQSPIEGNDAYYLLNIVMVDRNGDGTADDGYTLNAVPQVIGGQVDDQCGTLTLDDLGRKGIVGQAPGVTVAICWR